MLICTMYHCHCALTQESSMGCCPTLVKYYLTPDISCILINVGSKHTYTWMLVQNAISVFPGQRTTTVSVPSIYFLILFHYKSEVVSMLRFFQYGGGGRGSFCRAKPRSALLSWRDTRIQDTIATGLGLVFPLQSVVPVIRAAYLAHLGRM